MCQVCFYFYFCIFFIFFFLLPATVVLFIYSASYYMLIFDVLNSWPIALLFSPHSSLDGVDHLIRLFFFVWTIFLCCVCFIPSTELYSQPWALAIAPECSKRTVACRALCFLGTCALILPLHLLARLLFTAAGGPSFQTEVFISSWDPALLHEILLSTNDEKRTWSGGFEPTPLRANIFTKQILTPKTTVPWLNFSIHWSYHSW